MFKRKQPEVLIAGAGPVGQLCALMLARDGIAVEIVDEEWRPAGHSYALALHPASLQLLGELGLRDTIEKRSQRVSEVVLSDKAEERARVDLSAQGDPPHLAVVRQDVFEQALSEALAKQGVEVRWNHRLSRFEPGRDAVHVNVDELVKESVGYAVSHTEWLVGKSSDVDVPFVIGADGHRSLVRRQMGIDFESAGPTEYFAVFEHDTDADLGGEMRIIMDAESTSVLWPLPEGRCRWSFQIDDPSIPASSRHKDRLILQLPSGGYPVLERSHLEKLVQERAPWFRGTIGDVHWRVVVRFERRLAARFGEGRMWLLGDAGHMTGPVGVQSMNVGLREARELTTALRRILRDGGKVEELQEYGRARRSEWRGLLGLEGSLSAVTGTDPWIRERADRLLSCLPASGRELETMAKQIGLEWKPGG